MGIVYDLDDHFPNFLAFQNVARKMLRRNIEKSAKINAFGLPKPFQNPSQILPKTTFKKTCDF